jgi:hypothetical protein
MKTIVLTTRYLGPTHTTGSRIRVTSEIGTATFHYDYGAHRPHEAAVQDYIRGFRLGPVAGSPVEARGRTGYQFTVERYPQPQPSIWLLLRSERGIETYDDQFCAWWPGKPDQVELRAALEQELHTPEDVLGRVLAGEDPRPDESVWWRLKEVKSGAFPLSPLNP